MQHKSGFFARLLSGISLWAALAAAPMTASAASRAPNVLVILVDDLDWPDVSTYGLKRVQTPNIDRIAREGVGFTNGYVAASVCAPSRAALLTGRYEQRYGFEYNMTDRENIDDGLPLDQKTIADLLRPAGYYTGAIGKWDLGYTAPYYPMKRGFDDFFGFVAGETLYVDPRSPDMVTVQTPHKPTGDRRKRVGQIVEGPNAEVVHDFGKYLTSEFTARAVSFIDQHSHRARPFFLYLAYNAPHWPMQVPRRYYDRFAHIKDPIRRTYVAMIAALDDGVGTVLDTLQRDGIARDALVIFLSDNGCPEHLGFCDCSNPLGAGKFTYVEGGMRVPFMMAWPGHLSPHTLISTPVSSLDVMPTILAAAGVKAPPNLDGENLMATVEGRAPEPRLLFWRQLPVYAVREGRWKLWKSLDWKVTKLFDLQTDPAETTDVSTLHRRTVEQLSASLDRWNSGLANPKWPLHFVRKVDVCGRATEMVY